MARMAIIRSRRISVKNQKHNKYPPKNSPNQQFVKIIPIDINCMFNCGQTVKAYVNVLDIVPRLGRPRGMKVRCHLCNNKYRNYIVSSYGENYGLLL